MPHDEEIKGDETLVAEVPRHHRGRKIQKSLTQWNAITAVLNDADRLNVPQRSPDEILEDLHSFRESS